MSAMHIAELTRYFAAAGCLTRKNWSDDTLMGASIF
jgi:hypothetical protein